MHSSGRQDDLTDAITKAVLHFSYVPLAAVFLLAALALLAYVIASGQADLPTAGMVVLSLVGIGAAVLSFTAAWQRDQQVRVDLKYDLDEGSQNQWEEFCRVVDLLSSSGVKVLSGGAEVYNSKYHSGAGRLIDTASLTARSSYKLPRVVCHIRSPLFEPPGGTRYVFLPDRIVCLAGHKLSRLVYTDIRFDTGTTSIIRSWAPPGAKIVGHTWRYTNKDGGPDRRFKNNYQLPIVEYAVVRMVTSGGMDHALLFVSRTLATDFVRAITAMSAAQATYSRILPAPPGIARPARLEHTADNAPTGSRQARDDHESTDPFDAAFDALCCVMFADGSCSPEERAAIVRILTRVKAPWTEEEIVERMRRRWMDAKHRGIEAVFAETRHSLAGLRTERQQAVLRRCMQEVAKADGRVGQREQSAYRELLDSLPSLVTTSAPDA
jgi:uncharacterized tellurite resistance protein B-like protein